MLRNLIKKVWQQEGHEDLYTPQDANARFNLIYKDLLIGHLTLANGEWGFEYDEGFKNQNLVNKLIDFPEVKVYKSKELWPFFSSRIPGLGQPKVQKIIKAKNIDSNNEVELLKTFGRNTLTNPYSLSLM